MSETKQIVIVGTASYAEDEIRRLGYTAAHFDAHSSEEIVAAAARRARLLILDDGGSRLLSPSALSDLRDVNPALTVFQVVHDPSDLAGPTDETFVLPRDKASFSSKLELELKEVNLGRLRSGVLWSALRAVLTVAVLIGVWHFGVLALNLPPYLLPSPLRVLDAFAARPSSFLSHFGTTGMEAFVGFLVANVIGSLATVMLHRFQLAHSLVMPVFVAMQAVPIMALAPLLVVWLGTGLTSKIVMAAIICFFPIVINTLQSFKSMDADFIQLFQFHRASYLSTLRHLLVPASKPAIIAALRISGALAVVGAVVAEFTGASAGLGYLLLTASYRLETDIMFVAIILCAILGICFFHAPLLMAQAWVSRGARSQASQS